MPMKRPAAGSIHGSQRRKARRVDLNHVTVYTQPGPLPASTASHARTMPSSPTVAAPPRSSHANPPARAGIVLENLGSSTLDAREVAEELASRANSDSVLRDLHKTILRSVGNADQVQIFNAHVREIKMSLEIRKRQKASPSKPLPASTESQASKTCPPSMVVAPPRPSHTWPPAQAEAVLDLSTSSKREIAEVSTELTIRARTDPVLRDLHRKVVMAKFGTMEDVQRFMAYVSQIKISLEIQSRQCLAGRAASPPPPAQAPRSYVSPSIRLAQGTRAPASRSNIPSQRRSPSGVYPPRLKHSDHPDSGVGANFHSVPYPLSLLPFKSWEALHNENVKGVVCSSCSGLRPVTPHQRKLFLVAERLAWQNEPIPVTDRSKNEEALWAVNAELEIYEPAVEDEEVVIGGRKSRENAWFPFANQSEAEAVIRVVEEADVLSERSWSLWKQMVEEACDESSEADAKAEPIVGQPGRPDRQALGEISGNSRWLLSADHITRVKGKERAIIEAVDLSAVASKSRLPTPPSSAAEKTSAVQSKIKTLQDFYILLDKLERTSPMAAMFLEAYAERLRDELCKDCWFKHNVLSDDELDDTVKLADRPVWSKAVAAPLFD